MVALGYRDDWHPPLLLWPTVITWWHEAAAWNKGIKWCLIPGAVCFGVCVVRVQVCRRINSSLQALFHRNQKVAVICFESWKKQNRTVVFLWIDAPYLWLHCPRCAKVYGEDAQLVLAREVTKTFETFLSGTANLKFLVDVLTAQMQTRLRGEICRYVEL